MAVHALLAGVVEGQCRVALRTADNAMQPEQRISGQVVIEDNVGGPRVLPVAGSALSFELAPVRVLAAVASAAILWKLLLRDNPGVTGVAVDFGVRSDE